MKHTFEKGKKFGDLEVIGEAKVKINTTYRILMRCKCGKEYFVQCSSLVSTGPNKTTRCKECYNNDKRLTINVGDKSGEWTVLEYPIIKRYNSRTQHINVKVQCSCGKIVIMAASQFKRPDNHLQCRKCAGGGRLEYGFRPGFLGTLKKNASDRNMFFSEELTPEYLYNILKSQNFKCALSGEDLIQGEKGLDYVGIDLILSLDRIDSTIPYIKGNVQWVTKQVNMCKHILSVSDFINLCNKIINHTNQQPSTPLKKCEGSETNS